MPEPDDIIRRCMEAWSQEQEEYAAQLTDSLASLQAYEQELRQWEEQLTSKAEEIEQQRSEVEERRKELVKQQATDVAMTAELDQAKAELDDLRQRLSEVEDPVVAASAAVTDTEQYPSRDSKTKSGVELLDPAVSAVAKQFQKLRQQQAARRSR
ncbi:hypothetical protein [Aeoliella sp.]|uniref:hypothetical protein n=1 Tax=Aeoliella sp. TaxID=2795800 RepID=UPI003CCBA098